MEYYSALKRNNLSNYEKTCRKLKYILISERILIAMITHCENVQIMETVERLEIVMGMEGTMNRSSTNYS